MDSEHKHTIWLSTGSNLNEPLDQLRKAARLAAAYIGELREQSGIYRSPAWGYSSDHAFFNQCLALHTHLAPGQVMEAIRRIEKEMGRERKAAGYEDRVIDIDLLFYDDLILFDEELTIPHPRIPERRFVLLPLSELAPGFVHPGSGMTVAELLSACTDAGEVLPVTT
ncbi:MAG: 2-amino-4-hydroxy-6-hydroxymethyldihydropteridine diphosphokinase [Bacteroidota bacterium]